MEEALRAGSRGPTQGLRNESLSEQMRVLAEAQAKESDALRKEREKKRKDADHAHHMKFEALEEAHEEPWKLHR